MERKELLELLNGLSTSEKIGQLVQLSGDFFDESMDVTETGPSEKIGLAEEYNLYNTGSILNVLQADKIYQLQKNYLEKSRHKIPLMFMSDIIYGFNTIFPIPIAQTCSWDFELIEQSAAISAEEAYYAGQQVTFSPMVDLVKDPRWGRVMESPGEDPYIGTMFSKSVVEGLQGKQANKIEEKKLAACVKHYAAYGAAESGRDYNGVDMSLSKFYNQYLPAYKAAVDAKVKLVMTAFNTLNDVPCTGNEWLNKQVLREELDFEGVLITDYAAIEELIAHGYASSPSDAARIALDAEVDIDMKTAVYANHLEKLIEENVLSIEQLDQAVLRVLELKNDLGLFENPYRGLVDESVPTAEDDHREVALELAEKSLVLLKNNGILPLKKDKKIALVGPYGDNANTLGMWAINGDPSRTITLKTGMEQVFSESYLSFAEGAPLIENIERLGFSSNITAGKVKLPEYDKGALLEAALKNAREADYIVVAFGEHVLESGEAGSKTDLRISEAQSDLITQLAELNKPMIGVIYSGRPNNITHLIDKFDALVYAWYPGSMGGLAVANILSGRSNPSGKLTMSFPRNEGQIPVYYYNYRTGRPIKSDNENSRFTSRYIDESNYPLFPFGYGLSYSDFRYHTISASSKEIKEKEKLEIRVKISNESNVQGDEVVQLYIQDKVASISRPSKELKASKRITIAPHSTEEVIFKLCIDDFSFFDNKGTSVLETGEFIIFVGSNAEETPLSLEISYIAS